MEHSSSKSLPKFEGYVLLVKHYTRQLIRSNPEVLFVFGDNMARVGYGGQAREARGEPNTVGIPTKVSPSDYFYDDHFDEAKEQIVQAFVILAQHLRAGHDVVWPFDGVGTGLARLSETAPTIFAGLEDCKQGLFHMAKGVMVEP
jgi:hypothetical protein